jgi:hypothetical protein
MIVHLLGHLKCNANQALDTTLLAPKSQDHRLFWWPLLAIQCSHRTRYTLHSTDVWHGGQRCLSIHLVVHHFRDSVGVLCFADNRSDAEYTGKQAFSGIVFWRLCGVSLHQVDV